MLANAQKSLTKIKNAKMEAYGLGSAHTICICRLYEAPDGLTKTRLAALCGVDKAQISRLIAELEEKDYVTADTANTNYRQKYRLTEAGRSMAEEIQKIIGEVTDFVGGSIPPEELASFYQTLRTICDNLKKAEARYVCEKDTAVKKGLGDQDEE